ncbi:MAG: tRNA lysidine(34) synthetase TilS [Chloroflexota bacterium]
MVLKAIEKEHGRFLFAIPKMIVGVSGGADSLALLHLLKELIGAERLVVAHLDHGWRESSREDAEFVRQTAVSWRIPYHGQRLKSAKKKTGLEAAGREARYQFLKDVARCEGASYMAVGHNQDDQVETILQHLLRGSGVAGLRGMSFAYPLMGDEQFTLIRPLLNTSREDIETYCQMNHLIPRQDETNADPKFQRNRLRHELIPILKGYTERLDTNLLQLSDMIRAEDDLLTQIAQAQWEALLVDVEAGWLTLNRDAWQTLPVAMQRRLLRTAVSTLKPDFTEIGFRSIEAARLGLENGRFGQTFHLPSGVTVTVQAKTHLFSLPNVELTYDLPQLGESELLTLEMPGITQLANGWQIEAQIIIIPDSKPLFVKDLGWEAYLPVQKYPLILRTRQPGERVKPLGMNGRSRKLKKVMSEQHIPQSLRDSWPVLTIDDEVVWVPGVIRTESHLLTDEAHRAVHLQFRK